MSQNCNLSWWRGAPSEPHPRDTVCVACFPMNAVGILDTKARLGESMPKGILMTAQFSTLEAKAKD